MSHNPERKEKICLNCNSQVHGRFCHVCGQENVETKESFWSLTKHFVYDILHFDGKFFYSLKYIFTKPGLVARRYAEGKRVSFLHPIRMYLFTSAVFFIVFFSIKSFQVGNNNWKGYLDNEDRGEMAQTYKERLNAKPQDSFLRERIALLLDTARPLNIDSLGWNKSSGQILSFGDRNYNSISQYDSVQSSLPKEKKDGWFKQKFIRQGIKTNQKYGTDSEGAKAFIENFLHKLPYLLFISLPFFALTLKLLYARRKNFYYSDHAIFTLYHYIFSFMLLLVIFGIDALQSASHWGFFTLLEVIIAFTWPVYLFIEMKNFYRQGYGKTFIKFLLLNLLGLVTIILLFLFFFLFSIFQS